MEKIYNILEKDTKHTWTKNNHLYITQSFVSWGVRTHNTQRSRERRGDSYQPLRNLYSQTFCSRSKNKQFENELKTLQKNRTESTFFEEQLKKIGKRCTSTLHP